MKASENMDFKDLKSSIFRILEHWRSKNYFCKISLKHNFFFSIHDFHVTQLLFIHIEYPILQIGGSLPNMHKCKSSPMSPMRTKYAQTDQSSLSQIYHVSWNPLTIYLFERYDLSRIISPVHLKYCLPRWDMVSPTLPKHENLMNPRIPLET